MANHHRSKRNTNIPHLMRLLDHLYPHQIMLCIWFWTNFISKYLCKQKQNPISSTSFLKTCTLQSSLSLTWINMEIWWLRSCIVSSGVKWHRNVSLQNVFPHFLFYGVGWGKRHTKVCSTFFVVFVCFLLISLWSATSLCSLKQAHLLNIVQVYGLLVISDVTDM